MSATRNSTATIRWLAGSGCLLLMISSACNDAQQTAQVTRADSTEPAALTVEVEDQPQDSIIVEERPAWARSQHLDTLPIGQIVARMGRTFVGAPYIPGTLEVPGPERLVVNLREFDCVTFVESSLALARVVRAGKGGYDAFKNELRRLRYRGGQLDGYASRLHYFSEWLADNEAKGILQDITQQLGGERDAEPINFMSQHVESYRQLADSAQLSAIREIETRLNGSPRYIIPENRIAAVAARIQDGDVIAAASTLAGLDIAHTGIALRVGDQLHLMHAPLVGKAVEISAKPLAERIHDITTQDGIMVARPR